ncbi:MAG: hypothetical protein P8166_02735 [Candidatus Thiodiazotropha sp.]|jgi:hypothetical protein
MKPYLKLCLLTLLLPATSQSQGAEPANEHPQEHSKQTTHDRRGAKRLLLENADGAGITLWKPDLTTQTLKASNGGLTIPKTGMDNYHAIVAQKDWGESKETAIRYEFMFGRPSEHSPSELAGVVKTELEIVPAPIPREHFHYQSNQRWGFQVRLHGQPLAKLPLALETEHGTRLEAVTDKRGYASFRLPDDFSDVVEGQRDKRRAEFAVSAELESHGITYQTRLTASYHPDPSHWQSASLGWAVTGMGFIVGGLVGRKRKQKGKMS